jgi:hypothetical protein
LKLFFLDGVGTRSARLRFYNVERNFPPTERWRTRIGPAVSESLDIFE